MAKRKMTSDGHESSAGEHSSAASDDNGASPTTNKMEAVRRALRFLGKKAKPAEIRDYILREFRVDMKPNMISAYKSMLAKRGGKKGRPGRKPRPEAEASDTGAHGGVATTGGSVSSKDIFRDLRTLKELTDRLGPNRIRELLELMGH